MLQLAPGTALGFLLADVSRLFRQSFEKAIEQSGLGLTSGAVRTLAHVMAHDGSRQAVLADLMGIEPMTLSTYIDHLETKGFVTRMTDPSDRRARLVRPTMKAETLFAEIHPIADSVYGMAIKGLSNGQVEILEVGLAAMRANLCSHTAKA